MKSILIIVAVVAAFCLGFAYSNAMTVLPKDIGTANRLKVMERTIKKYVAEKHKLPSGLTELIAGGYIDKDMCLDRWGNEIVYSVLNDNMVCLVSNGDPSIRRSFGLEYRISNTFPIQQNLHKTGEL